MHYSIFRSFTTFISVIFIIILIHNCVRVSSDDRSIINNINTRDIIQNSSFGNLTNDQTSKSGKYPMSSPVHLRYPYNNLFMTMIINSLTVELKKLADSIQQVNKYMSSLINHQLKITSDGGDYSRMKRQTEEEIFKNNNHKISMSTNSKKIPIKTINNHKNSPSHKNFKRNIISYLKQIFNDNQDAESETSTILGSIAKDYSTTECYYADDTTVEENISTRKTSTTSLHFETSTQPLSSVSPDLTSSTTLQETLCKTEDISASPVSFTAVNTEEITTTSTPIDETTIQEVPTTTTTKNNPSNPMTIINDGLKNILTTSEHPSSFSPTAAVTSTTCYYDTETETTESSLNTDEPYVQDHTDDNSNNDDNCGDQFIHSNSRKLLEKLMHLKPIVKQFETIDSMTPLKLTKRNSRTNHIKLIKNLKDIKRKTSLLSNMNNGKLGQFNGIKDGIKKHMRVGRTLKSYEFIESYKPSLLPTITSQDGDYGNYNNDNGDEDHDDIRVEYVTNEYDNTREIIDEAPFPITEGSTENLNTTLDDKFMNEKVNVETLKNFNRNNSNTLEYNFKESDHYCANCICNIEYALMSLKRLLEMRNDLLNRISLYSCNKFLQIGKYILLNDHIMSYDSSGQTLININDKVLKYIQCNDSEDFLDIDEDNSNEHETLYIPGSSYLINVPCYHLNDNKINLIMNKCQRNYSWIRHDGGPVSGVIRDNGDLELYQVDRDSNVENYSCIVTYIDPDDNQLIKNIYKHTVKSVTLPQYIIRGDNYYKLDNFDEYKLDTLVTYLKNIFNKILCKHILCDAFIFAPQYNNRNVYIKILIIPSNVWNLISPDMTLLCDVKCHRAIQNKIVLLLIHNFRAILQKPIIFRLSNHRHGRLVPIKTDENAELKVEQKQEQKEKRNIDNDDADEDVVGLLVGCPIGYRLESSFCEPCPTGFYSQDLSWHCQQCPLGTYQLKTGAKTCEKCTNPFVNGCFFMLWSSLLIAIIVLVLLLIMFLIGIITFWSMCYKKRYKECRMYEEFADDENKFSTVPLIPSKINVDSCRDEDLTCGNSCEQTDIEEELLILPNDKKKLLIYGINLLPSRRINE